MFPVGFFFFGYTFFEVKDLIPIFLYQCKEVALSSQVVKTFYQEMVEFNQNFFHLLIDCMNICGRHRNIVENKIGKNASPLWSYVAKERDCESFTN